MPGPKKKREPSGRDMARRYHIRCFAPVAKDVEGLLVNPVSFSLADLPAGRYIWVWAGAPGTRLSFGKWTRRGWMGAGYLVARRLDPDGVTSHLVDRFGQD